MLTYESMKSFFFREKESQAQLTPLPPDFFQQVQEYFETKGRIQKEGRWELEDVRNCFLGILEMRMRKILLLAFDHVRAGVYPKNLAGEEKAFFERVAQEVREFQKKLQEAAERKGM